MTSRTRLDRTRRENPHAERGWLVAAAVLVGIALIALIVWVGALVSDATTPRNPAQFFLELIGPRTYPATGLLVVVPLLMLLGGVAFVLVRVLKPTNKSRMDPKSHSMARGKDLGSMTGQSATLDAERLGATKASASGVPVGRLVPAGTPISASWEWVQVWVLGPRAGKTSCVCVPQVTQTAGPVVATTNKRDLVDMTRGPRSRHGHVWVFDPQQIIGEDPSWWWNPLTYVTGLAEAEELAKLFAASSKEEGAQTDAYFDPEAQNYLASLLLAAAVGQEPITAIHEWISRPGDTTPAELLRMGGHTGVAKTLESIIDLTDRQRDGVTGTARKMITWLANDQLLPWITPNGPHDDRPQFDPHTFVQSSQTLLLVSREGRGTARAATVALTVATVVAAEQLAARSPKGRLPTPMTVVLDEAANVVRWPDLPDLYSHFGSRGIVMSTFLQSWNQGVAVWGRDGMEKLWSAANLRVVGAGLAQADFLNNVSALIGDHDVVRRDSSINGRSGGILDSSGRSVSTRIQREKIFDAAELAALPRGRAVMLSSGSPAALIELVHWSEGPDADEIAASEDFYTNQVVNSAPARETLR